MFGYVLMVCFKWSPQTEGHLKALALPVWAILLFYLGECVCVCVRESWREGNPESSLPLERFRQQHHEEAVSIFSPVRET